MLEIPVHVGQVDRTALLWKKHKKKLKNINISLVFFLIDELKKSSVKYLSRSTANTHTHTSFELEI